MIIPDPLHPAVVHFPIVLVMAGAALACWTLLRPGRAMAMAAAVVMSLAALSSQVAIMTGELDEEAGEEAAEALLEEHEEAAETTRWLVIAASLASIGACVAIRRGKYMRPVAAVAAGVALASVGAMIRTGHLGGEMVYRYGAGVATDTQNGLPERKTRHHDDDD